MMLLPCLVSVYRSCPTKARTPKVCVRIHVHVHTLLSNHLVLLELRTVVPGQGCIEPPKVALGLAKKCSFSLCKLSRNLEQLVYALNILHFGCDTVPYSFEMPTHAWCYMYSYMYISQLQDLLNTVIGRLYLTHTQSEQLGSSLGGRSKLHGSTFFQYCMLRYWKLIHCHYQIYPRGMIRT